MTEKDRAETAATYAVTLPADMTDSLADFLRRMGVEFRPRDMALRLNDAGCDPGIMHGHEADGLLREINAFLRKRRMHPLVPGDADRWTHAQLHEFLELAMEHFQWDGGDAVEGAWWLDQGVHWREVARSFRELFSPARDRTAPSGAARGDSAYIQLHEGNVDISHEVIEDSVILDLDSDNRVMGIDLQGISGLEEETRAPERPGTWLKLIDPEHEDETLARLMNANDHFRRMAAGVLNDEAALRLIAILRERKTVEIEEVLDRTVPLARLAAANFCEVGAKSVWITMSGMGFVDSIRNAPDADG